ncbi:MAG: hypothetical protein GXY36_11295 [Chloroflexi bacterium]|nr:hypothetical protein [Chloroflexota bacterium]
MRVVTNEALISRNRRISHILFFVSLAGMGIGFFYTWTDPVNSSSISCFILPILLLMTIASVRMANTWIREPRPNTALNEALKGLGHHYTLFHYLLPAQHVLVGPEGVFTITPVWQDRPYQVRGRRWYGDRGIMRRIVGYLRQDLVGNPFREAAFDAQQVQRMVNKLAPDAGIEVQPLVVFTSPRANFEAEDPEIPVLYADPKKKPSLRGYLRDQKGAGRATLALEHMDQIDRSYGLITREDLGLAAGYEPDEDEIEDTDVEPVESGPAGTVYIVRGGSLYNIGVAFDTVDEDLEALRAEGTTDLELIHTIETDQPEKLRAFLHRKYDRKRQKGEWFGLSKKDIAWLKTLEGDFESIRG